ncbi:MAG: DUF4174 domain-containing protein [Fulvivirga sp.]|nr:DUF4174 domain-containing protein [Fulvivirga sp.]
MKTLISIIVLFMMMDTDPLEKYHWKNRILIVFSKQDTLLDKQLQEWQADGKGLDNRDLVIFTIKKTPEQSKNPDGEAISPELHQWFLQTYNAPNRDFLVVLIGKDGGKKLRKTSLLSTEKLFSTIDAMPMRQREMKDDIR